MRVWSTGTVNGQFLSTPKLRQYSTVGTNLDPSLDPSGMFGDELFGNFCQSPLPLPHAQHWGLSFVFLSKSDKDCLAAQLLVFVFT